MMKTVTKKKCLTFLQKLAFLLRKGWMLQWRECGNGVNQQQQFRFVNKPQET